MCNRENKIKTKIIVIAGPHATILSSLIHLMFLKYLHAYLLIK